MSDAYTGRMRPLNIVIYDVTPAGGVERVAVNLANALADTHHVNIVSLYSTGGQPFYSLDDRVTITHLGVPFTPGLRHYASQSIHTLKALREKVTFTPRAVTLGMSVNPNILLALLKKAGTPGRFIGCEHMNYDDAVGLARRLRQLTYPLLDDVVVLTPAEQQVFRQRLGMNVRVIPNQVSFRPAQPAPLTSKRLVSVGRYTHQKGYDRLIPALAPVMRDFPEWTLDIHGKGEQDTELRHLILREGVTNIRLHPPTTQVQEELMGASIYLLPSRFEALPMVVLEAQACGLPVVAYDSSNGPRALVNSGNGVLVPDGDGAAFAQAVRDLMLDAERRRVLGAEARRNAERYAPDAIRAQWLNLLA